MNTPRLHLLTAVVAAATFLVGCGTLTSPPTARALATAEPTALIIADERGPLSSEAMAIRRPMVVEYLISRGYITGPGDLVDNPAGASRFIRVVFSAGGGFRITEFTLGNRSRHTLAASFVPGHSDNYGEYSAIGQYSYQPPRPTYLYDAPVVLSPPERRARPADQPRRYDRGGDKVGAVGRAGNDHGDHRQAPPTPRPDPSPRIEPNPAQPAGEARFEEQSRPNQP